MSVLRPRPPIGSLFQGQDVGEYLERKTAFIQDHARRLNRVEAMGRTEDELLSLLQARWEEHPVSLDIAALRQLPTSDVLISNRRLDNILSQYQQFDVPGTLFTFAVPFRGGLNYFELRTSSLAGGAHGEVVPANPQSDDVPSGEIHFKYEAVQATAAEIKRELDYDLAQVGRVLDALRQRGENFNAALPALLSKELADRRAKLKRDDEVAQALGIPITPREGAPKPFAVPVRTVVRLAPLRQEGRLTQEEWVLEEANYDLILGVLRDLGRSMERTASAFEKMREPHLRDIILFVLNGHFRGTGTGETFNGKGRTDILMRWEGKNAFIAECKYWDGPVSLTEAIHQLSGYACWSDTKVTLLMINRDRRMSTVLEEIRSSLPKHAGSGERAEEPSSNEFRCVIPHPTDSGVGLALTVLVYNVRRAEPAPHAT